MKIAATSQHSVQRPALCQGWDQNRNFGPTQNRNFGRSKTRVLDTTRSKPDSTRAKVSPRNRVVTLWNENHYRGGWVKGNTRLDAGEGVAAAAPRFGLRRWRRAFLSLFMRRRDPRRRRGSQIDPDTAAANRTKAPENAPAGRFSLLPTGERTGAPKPPKTPVSGGSPPKRTP